MAESITVSVDVVPRTWVKVLLWLAHRKSPLLLLFRWVGTERGSAFTARYGFNVSIRDRGR